MDTKNRIKDAIDDFKIWWKEPSLSQYTNGAECIGSFMAGSGEAAWAWLIVLNIFMLVTKQKLELVKVKK